MHFLKNTNAAMQIREYLGADTPEAFMGAMRSYRGPTPSRPAKGRKAGAYSRGLHNNITRKQGLAMALKK